MRRSSSDCFRLFLSSYLHRKWSLVGMFFLAISVGARGSIGTFSMVLSKQYRRPSSSLKIANLANAVKGEESSGAHRVCIAVGSNVGDRFLNIHRALQLLCQDDTDTEETNYCKAKTRLIKTSFLRETEPMYVTNQPNFLNGAVLLETSLSPRRLLQRIKMVESRLGRDLNAARNGPRPVDLDIILCETLQEPFGNVTDESSTMTPNIMNEHDLVIPHAAMHERAFVLEPAIDLLGGNYVHPVLNKPLSQILEELNLSGDDEATQAVRVIPLPRNRLLHFNETKVMGILNVTPDSFSDGGKWSTVDTAVKYALAMEQDGASIIDIGGESTRPGAREMEVEVEMQRTIPVIERLRELSDIPISIDTRHSQVARAAVAAGADMVNDVSGGQFDDSMLGTVAELAVPMVIMHMRGTPETMQSLTKYDDVVRDVAITLSEQSALGERVGVYRWLQIMDPGIGFAKDMEGNLKLLKNLNNLRLATGNLPILLGTSRKGFIGRLTGTAHADDRDPGTIATIVAALCLDDTARGGCNLVRVHNVAACKQATMIVDAMFRS